MNAVRIMENVRISVLSLPMVDRVNVKMDGP